MFPYTQLGNGEDILAVFSYYMNHPASKREKKADKWLGAEALAMELGLEKEFRERFPLNPAIADNKKWGR